MAEAQQEDANRFALVLVDKDKAIGDWLADQNVKSRKARRVEVDPHAYLNGVEDSSKITVSKPLEAGR